MTGPGTTRADPPVREDARCQVCGGKRGLVPKTGTQRSKQQLARELASDPFCATTCCRKWHGTSLDGQPAKAHADNLEWTHA